METTKCSCVGIYLWFALTLLFYILSSVRLLLFHYYAMLVLGDTNKQMNQKQGSRFFCNHNFLAISES